MINQILMNSVMFTVFNTVKEKANSSAYLNENSSALVAGLFSGFATACLSTPTDWIKIQAQISLSNINNTTGVGIDGSGKKPARFDMSAILRQCAMKDGNIHPIQFTRTIFSGHVANLGREGVFTMVYLGLYDRITNAVKVRRQQVDNGADDCADKQQPLSMVEVIAISSSTGACAWLCNYPFDTVKTVMQAGTTSTASSSVSHARQQQSHRRVSIMSAIQTIYNSGGWKAFWRGAGPSTVRAMLVTSSRMVAYEKTIQWLSSS